LRIDLEVLGFISFHFLALVWMCLTPRTFS
jgi:hypothetical protein